MVPKMIEGEVFEEYFLWCHLAEDLPKHAIESTGGTVGTSCSISLGMSTFMVLPMEVLALTIVMAAAKDYLQEGS
jgi:hypothetical protein